MNFAPNFVADFVQYQKTYYAAVLANAIAQIRGFDLSAESADALIAHVRATLNQSLADCERRMKAVVAGGGRTESETLQ